MILTRNVMIDRKCRESSRNVVLNETNKDGLQPFQHWADSMRHAKYTKESSRHRASCIVHRASCIVHRATESSRKSDNPRRFLSLVFSLDQKDHVEVQKVESVFQEFQGR